LEDAAAAMEVEIDVDELDGVVVGECRASTWGETREKNAVAHFLSL
jgi:hypothetical protein